MGKTINKFLNNNLDGKEKKYNIIKLVEIILSVLFVIFGIILFSNNILDVKKISIFLGIFVLLYSILNIYSAISSNSNKLFKMNIIFGAIYAFISILLFTNFIKLVNYLPVYFGAFLVIAGIKQLIVSIRLKMVRESSFLLVLVMSILILALGLLLIFYPFESFDIIELTAVFSILYGLLNINTSNLLRNRVKKFLSKVDN